MKRLVLVLIVMLVLVPLAAVGCAEKEPAVTPPEEVEEVVSTCVSCHSDKDMLKEVASPEPAEEKSEATTGEG